MASDKFSFTYFQIMITGGNLEDSKQALELAETEGEETNLFFSLSLIDWYYVLYRYAIIIDIIYFIGMYIYKTKRLCVKRSTMCFSKRL